MSHTSRQASCWLGSSWKLRSFGSRQSLRFATSDVGVAMGQSQHNTHLSQLPVKTLGRLLAQPGALNSVDYQAAVRLAMEQVDAMDGKDCIRVLGALKSVSETSRPDAASLQSLGVQLSERLGEISSNDMAELAENLASVSAPVAPVFARLSAAFSSRVSAANPRQLTKVASAFARARLADRRLMPRLAQGALKQLHLFAPQDLSAFISSFAAVGLCHEPLLTGSAKVVVQLGPRLSALDLALVAFSYAQFFLVFPTVVSLLQERLPSCAHELPPERLAELSVSCARLEVRPMNLLSIFARNLDLSCLSNELLGQVSKSLSLLGLASSPSISTQLEHEFRQRLGQKFEAQTEAWWAVDVLDCLAAAADDSRLNQGGVVSLFWRSVLESLCPLLSDLIPSFTAAEAATCYRSLRQLPPSLVRIHQSTLPVHEQLALRCLSLASVEAFSFPHLTSVAYSQFCLYPHLCLDKEMDGLSNPSWRSLTSSWKITSDAWSVAVEEVAEVSELEAQGRFQAEVLSMIFDLFDQPGLPLQTSQHRPVALELQEHIRATGHEVKGPVWEGPFEIHAQSGTTAFCLMPTEAYFRKLPGDVTHVTQQGLQENSELHELCHERFAQISLLRSRGWNAVPVAFETWRRLDSAQRLALLEEMLREKMRTWPEQKDMCFWAGQKRLYTLSPTNTDGTTGFCRGTQSLRGPFSPFRIVN
ncbi:unnamed protein product [Durusdinium trenchii]|uniref:RAP domain-containing protein n=1 Tax=Durusdinium trenchii TaxID=1381693 RepID=A0ABP0MP35_9DINO